MRPVLKPALRRLWRDPHTVQLGVDPRHAVVLAGLTGPLAETLDLLDGTRDRDEVVREAARRGADPLAAGALLDALVHAGAVDDAAHPLGEVGLLPAEERDRLEPERAGLSLRSARPGAALDALARRRRSHVTVVGTGRIGAPLAAQLAASGVGALTLVDPVTARPTDAAPAGLPLAAAGRARAAAAADVVRAIAPASRVQEASELPAICDLVVVSPADVSDPDLTAALVRRMLPHLFVAVRESAAVVGPYVLPGVTSCARCHDLVRAERDPAWPRLAGQLATAARGGTTACEAALAATAAAIGALQALAALDGDRPATTDATLELAPPDWRLRRRTWPLHPDCGCAARAAS